MGERTRFEGLFLNLGFSIRILNYAGSLYSFPLDLNTIDHMYLKLLIFCRHASNFRTGISQ